jgi:hypothetical protein
MALTAGAWRDISNMASLKQHDTPSSRGLLLTSPVARRRQVSMGGMARRRSPPFDGRSDLLVSHGVGVDQMTRALFGAESARQFSVAQAPDRVRCPTSDVVLARGAPGCGGRARRTCAGSKSNIWLALSDPETGMGWASAADPSIDDAPVRRKWAPSPFVPKLASSSVAQKRGAPGDPAYGIRATTRALGRPGFAIHSEPGAACGRFAL